MIAGYAAQGVVSVRHPLRQGVGAAIRTGIRYGRDNGYDIIVIMAGNDKDEPEEIHKLVEPIQRNAYDLVQGSRYLSGERTGGDMPFYRKVATRMHPLLFSLLTGHPMTDTTNGFRAIRLAIFTDERINLDQDWLMAYELEPYILFKAVKSGFRDDRSSGDEDLSTEETGLYQNETHRGLVEHIEAARVSRAGDQALKVPVGVLFLAKEP